MPGLVHAIDGALPVLFPDISADLQCLNEKVRFYDAAVSGLQIEKIRSASALTPNALKHVINFYEKVGILSCATPCAFCNRHELVLQRPADAACASQRLQFPRLHSACVVRLVGFERTDNRAFFALRTQPCIQRPDVPLCSWLRHGDHKILRGVNVISHKQDVQVRAVADLASSKFSERDDGQLLTCEELRDENQARFRDIGKLGKSRRRLDKSKHVAQDDAQQLPLPVGAYGVEIVCICV